MPRYLVSFLDIDSTTGAVIHGNFEYTPRRPIQTFEEITDLTDALRHRQNLVRPVVMGFSLFAEEGR